MIDYLSTIANYYYMKKEYKEMMCIYKGKVKGINDERC